MKRKTLILETLTALVIMTFMGVTVPISASDFFPHDIWEELETWEQNNVVAYGTANEAARQVEQMKLNNAGVAQLSFPFDVWAELDDLEVSNGQDVKSFSESSAAKKMNPYWLPEEYRAP